MLDICAKLSLSSPKLQSAARRRSSVRSLPAGSASPRHPGQGRCLFLLLSAAAAFLRRLNA